MHRHGARYPALGYSTIQTFASEVKNLTKNGTVFTGPLEILNTYEYQLGGDILVPRGRQELFDSGVLHQYNYGKLYPTNKKLLARTTTQDRMLKSAENFMAGFFGLEWQNNVTLEVIIEASGYNDSLAAYYECPNSNLGVSTGGTNASNIWIETYLANATERFRQYSGDYNWTASDSYNLQTLCPYETVAYGYSVFCDLFTYEEWQGFEYSIDMQFAGNNAFQSPTGRAVGIAYVEEFKARLANHLLDIGADATQVNYTLDTSNLTFPLNQPIYFDFSHDTNIMSILTSFGFKQFSGYLPITGPPTDQQLIVSHITPFGMRFVTEIIRTPYPVSASRSSSNSSTIYDTSGNSTTYIHFILNQRTLPAHSSFSTCPYRDDGWCELNDWLKSQQDNLELANFKEACFGDYAPVPYGTVTDGAPVNVNSTSS